MDKIYYFSAPGRTELGGNHTDHQHGCVLAAAIDLATTAQVQLNGMDQVRVRSEGYTPFEISLSDLSFREAETGTTAALVRGILAEFVRRGADIQGFDMEVSSNVLPGSGLSSSAAFEVLVGTICNTLFFDAQLSPQEIAGIGQLAENRYFGKPCGLMDQMASAVGGLVFIDFGGETPQVEQLTLDLQAAGYQLCIIDTGADHAGLTEEYAAITKELGQISRFFGKSYLREVPEDMFMKALPALRGNVPDRAILRAMHVYEENRRVLSEKEALQAGDLEAFLDLVDQSGHSSWMYLQNIYPSGAAAQQPMALALALCRRLLDGQGACRVHGGGFAGTIQAYVPTEKLASFVSGMEGVLGAGCCKVLQFSPIGGTLQA